VPDQIAVANKLLNEAGSRKLMASEIVHDITPYGEGSVSANTCVALCSARHPGLRYETRCRHGQARLHRLRFQITSNWLQTLADRDRCAPLPLGLGSARRGASTALMVSPKTDDDGQGGGGDRCQRAPRTGAECWSCNRAGRLGARAAVLTVYNKFKDLIVSRSGSSSSTGVLGGVIA
jgi:hypothetical protein